MGLIKLAYGNAVLVGFGSARVNLFIWFSSPVNAFNRCFSRPHVDSGFQSLSSDPSSYFSVDYMADPNRSQMAAQMDGCVACISCGVNFPNEETWSDGAEWRIAVRYVVCVLGQPF